MRGRSGIDGASSRERRRLCSAAVRFRRATRAHSRREDMTHAHMTHTRTHATSAQARTRIHTRDSLTHALTYSRTRAHTHTVCAVAQQRWDSGVAAMTAIAGAGVDALEAPIAFQKLGTCPAVSDAQPCVSDYFGIRKNCDNQLFLFAFWSSTVFSVLYIAPWYTVFCVYAHRCTQPPCVWYAAAVRVVWRLCARAARVCARTVTDWYVHACMRRRFFIQCHAVGCLHLAHTSSAARPAWTTALRCALAPLVSLIPTV
jgi:hypothetical protein